MIRCTTNGIIQSFISSFDLCYIELGDIGGGADLNLEKKLERMKNKKHSENADTPRL